MKKLLLSGSLLIFSGVFSFCKKNSPVSESAFQGEPVIEEKFDYPASPNDDLAALGRVLFYDQQLSHNNSVSCGSCHQQAKGFCDNQAKSPGLHDKLTGRNTPSIFSKNGRLFWDGRAAGIRDLVLRPVKDHVEMGIKDPDFLVEKISALDYYPALFQKAFKSSHIDTSRIQEAMVEFLKNFTFVNNKFRRSMASLEPLNASEQLGKDLFFGKARCINCHKIDNPDNPDGNGGGGGYGGNDQTSFLAKNIGLDKVYQDNGVGAISRQPRDYGLFAMPVIFNIEYTPPYMHDGRFATLEEVVEHYNSGIQDHPNLDPELRNWSNFPGLTPQAAFHKADLNSNGMLEENESKVAPPVRLNLTAAEKRNLVDFLKTLSDPGVKTDKRFSDPFKVKSL